MRASGRLLIRAFFLPKEDVRRLSYVSTHLVKMPSNQPGCNFATDTVSGKSRSYHGPKVADAQFADIVVDLRSDTVTRPSKKMRDAIANALVGDDVVGEDPTVEELERRTAELLGKEAGLLVPSGTMGNLLAGLVHCNERGSEMIVGDNAHMFFYEQGGLSQFGGVQPNPVPNEPDGTFSVDGARQRIRAVDFHYPITKLISVENTHNRCGGRALPLKWLDEITQLGKDHGIALHMDGARVFNAALVTGVPASRIVRDFDSVSVCFSKGLGCPVGSVLVGSQTFIQKARRLRKGLGGGMRQAGVLAAAGLYSLDNILPRLQEDHANAKKLAQIVNSMKNPNVFVHTDAVESNFVILNVTKYSIDEFCQRLGKINDVEKQKLGRTVSILCWPRTDTSSRLVFHCDVSAEMAIKAAEKICLVTEEFAKK